ncbi:cyclic lactone autoinducer peptide [Acetivibrio cellulolyticus]|nr:cyclic lactone autoinducer peptide [Acetivibrio cellulolyticus]
MKKFWEAIAVVLTVFAVFSVSTACWFLFYQPKVPKSVTILKK